MLTRRKLILVADDDPTSRQLTQIVLSGAGHTVITAQDGADLVRSARDHASRLALILTDQDMPFLCGSEAIRILRDDGRTAHLPMLLVSGRSDPAEIATGLEDGADDYLVKPWDLQVLVARVNSLLRRATQVAVTSPLTGLPANRLISEEITHRLAHATPFVLLHIDLDFFKAYNDVYGFTRGDQVITLAADVLTEAVTRCGNPTDFVGHIGGDDFVVITGSEVLDAVCQYMIEQFDTRIRALCDEADLRRGYLEVEDRRSDSTGTVRTFPITRLSIAGVPSFGQYTTAAEITQAATDMKHQAKRLPGTGSR
jgi:diguanylate cyclase (GGDEF)-like protein